MHVVARALSKLLHPLESQTVFELFQRWGIHVTRNHFYSPIPDTRRLGSRRDLWEENAELVGVDLNVEGQLELLDRVFPRFKDECQFPLEKTAVPHEYCVKGGQFGFVSAAVLHCMIRHYRPKTIIEVGSGSSTYVSARASLMNSAEERPTRLVAVEPYPNPVLNQGFPGLSELICSKVEDMDVGFFSQLEAGDILFIDSSHVVRMGGDVNFLYLEVLPRLREGVLVHVHDIFFPRQYPEDWVVRQRLFWTEQYLLQAFLTFNSRFQVLWSSSYMCSNHPDRLRSTFPPPEGLGEKEGYFSSSFWMRRVG